MNYNPKILELESQEEVKSLISILGVAREEIDDNLADLQEDLDLAKDNGSPYHYVQRIERQIAKATREFELVSKLLRKASVLV